MILELFLEDKFDEIIKLIKQDKYLDEVYKEDGSNLLHNAVYFNQLKMVKLLLKKGFDINAVDDNGVSALGYALGIMQGYEIVKLLINSGADVNCKGEDGTKALMLAFSKCHYYDYEKSKEIIKMIIDRAGEEIDFNLYDKNSSTPMHYVAEHNDYKFAKFLIEKGVDLNVKSSFLNATPLGQAIARNNFKIMKLLIDNGVVPIGYVKDEKPALIVLLNFNSYDDVKKWLKYLIDNGADVNEADINGNTPLMKVVQRKSLEGVKYLLKKGANPTYINSNSQSALDMAKESLKKLDPTYNSPFEPNREKEILSQEEIDALLEVVEDETLSKKEQKELKKQQEKDEERRKQEAIKDYREMIDILEKEIEKFEVDKSIIFAPLKVVAYFSKFTSESLINKLTYEEFLYLYKFSDSDVRYKLLLTLTQNRKFLILEDVEAFYLPYRISKDRLEFEKKIYKKVLEVDNYFNIYFKEKIDFNKFIEEIKEKGIDKMYANSELKYTKEEFEPLIHKIVDYSQQARRDGILSLEKSRQNEKNIFLNMALMHAIDGFDNEVIKRTLNLEIKYTIKYFKQNPKKLISNEVSKDEFKIALDKAKREMKIIRDGVLAIPDGDNPRMVEELLCKYIVGEEYKSRFD